jgi:hypothetical protein
MVVWYIHRSGILHGIRKYILLGVKKAQIDPQSPKTEFGAQHQYGRVIYPSIKNFTWSKKKYTFGGHKVENRPPEPKINMVVWYIHRSGILHKARKNILLGVKKVKISPQSPKTEFWAQNQYGRVIYPSIGNFTWSKKKYTFGGQKGKNKVSVPENGT